MMTMIDESAVPASPGFSAVPPPPPAEHRPPEVLQRGVPILLRIPANVGGLLCAILGGFWGLVLAVGISVLAPENSSIGHMFTYQKFDSIIPVLIMMLFCCGLAICLFRAVRLLALHSACRRRDWRELLAYLEAAPLAEAVSATEVPAGQASPLFRRVHAIARQWQTSPGLAEADIINQQLADEDDNAVHAGYGTLRMFIWALPVLGLIGTVIGISLAVGGFASFLGGEIDDVGVIKKSLVSVTAGLSFAFLITLLGLATSLVLMFIVSALQSREERFYGWINSRITDELIVALQRVAPVRQAEVAAAAAPAATLSAEQMMVVAARVFETVQAAAEQTLASVRREEGAMRERMGAWLAAEHQEFQAAAGQFAGAVERSLEGVRQLHDEYAAAGAAAQTHTQASIEQLRAVLAEHAEALRLSQERTSEATREQNAALRANFEAISEIARATQNTIAAQTSLQQAIAAIDHSALQVAFAGLRDAMNTQSQDLRDISEQVRAWQNLAQQVIVAQTALQHATAQLKDTQLSETLASFRDSLVDLKPVLTGFRKPFVLQAVPVDGEN